MKKEKILAISVVVMIIAVAIWGARRPDLIPSFNLVLLAGLIGVTTVYAYSAIRQANASVKMAEETKEQRYSESLPLLVPDVIPKIREQKLEPNEIVYVELQSAVKVIWHNLGKGVAINTRFSFSSAPTSPGKATFFPPCELGTVEIGGKKEVDYGKILNDGQSTAISDGYQPRLEAVYQDIYKRSITTVQEFRIDKQNERAFLGDIYFTVNGRRLGEEVARHD